MPRGDRHGVAQRRLRAHSEIHTLQDLRRRFAKPRMHILLCIFNVPREELCRDAGLIPKISHLSPQSLSQSDLLVRLSPAVEHALGLLVVSVVHVVTAVRTSTTVGEKMSLHDVLADLPISALVWPIQ